jgi:hypothetical protein
MESSDEILQHLEKCLHKKEEDKDRQKDSLIDYLNSSEVLMKKSSDSLNEIEMYVAERLAKMYGEKIQTVNVIDTSFGAFAISNEGIFISGSEKAYKKWAYAGQEVKNIPYKLDWKKVIICSSLLLATIGGSIELTKFTGKWITERLEDISIPKEFEETRTGYIDPCRLDQPYSHICNSDQNRDKANYQRIIARQKTNGNR